MPLKSVSPAQLFGNLSGDFLRQRRLEPMGSLAPAPLEELPKRGRVPDFGCGSHLVGMLKSVREKRNGCALRPAESIELHQKAAGTKTLRSWRGRPDTPGTSCKSHRTPRRPKNRGAPTAPGTFRTAACLSRPACGQRPAAAGRRWTGSGRAGYRPVAIAPPNPKRAPAA